MNQKSLPDRRRALQTLALTALLSAFGAALGYIDAILPVLNFIPAPGIKLGLANAATLFALYFCGTASAAAVQLVRILLVNLLLFPSVTSLVFSLSGGIFAFAVMLIFKKAAFHTLSVSVVGACAHNLAQLTAASILFSTPKIFSYAAVLFPVGILTGALLGLLVSLILPRVGRITKQRADQR